MNAAFQVDLATATGKTPSAGSDGNEVVVDSAKADGQKFLFSELESIHTRFPDVQGVLGQWFLSRFDYMLDLRGQRLEFGKQDRNGTRARFTMLNGRPAISTNLGDLVLDSGAALLVLFGVEPYAGYAREVSMRTLTGSQVAGLAPRTLIVEGRTIWHGDAVAIPNRPEPAVYGLMPLSLFKQVYFCNSENYVILQ